MCGGIYDCMKYVITESQYRTALMESLPSYIRRRLNPEGSKHLLDNLTEYDIPPCSYDDVGEFVSVLCDILTDIFFDDISTETPVKVKPKDKDYVYNYFVDLFGNYLVNIHKTNCS